MSINFPDNPYVGEPHVFGNITWVWNGSAWDRVSTATGYIGATGPRGATGATGAIPTAFVASINGLTGTVGISAGSFMQVTQSGNTITISGDSVIYGGVF